MSFFSLGATWVKRTYTYKESLVQIAFVHGRLHSGALQILEYILLPSFLSYKQNKLICSFKKIEIEIIALINVHSVVAPAKMTNEAVSMSK